jgi:hypothetical protein
MFKNNSNIFILAFLFFVISHNSYAMDEPSGANELVVLSKETLIKDLAAMCYCMNGYQGHKGDVALTFQEIFKVGISVNHKFEGAPYAIAGATPLILACAVPERFENDKVLPIVLNTILSHPDINCAIPDDRCRTPLMHSVQEPCSGPKEAFKRLCGVVKNGKYIGVGLQDNNGDTPLHVAIRNASNSAFGGMSDQDWKKITSLLLAGAPTYMPNDMWQTEMHMLEEKYPEKAMMVRAYLLSGKVTDLRVNVSL